MKNLEDSQDIKPNKKNTAKENPVSDTGSGSVSVSSNDKRKVSREDIELVQNLIERCLQLYMNREEIVKTLLNRARIDPGFTTLVWKKLEEENAEFFRAYYIRLKLKKQIILFNHLLEHQYQLMKYPKIPLAPMHSGFLPMPPGNNLPMGYPIMHHPPIPVPVPGQPHIDPIAYSPASGCHIVNGVPAPASFQPMRMSSGHEVMMDNSTTEMSPIIPPNQALSDIPVSPTSVASSGHFPFNSCEISGIGVDSAFTSDNGVGNSRDSLRSLDQIPWNFSLSDLSADLSNLGDLGALGSYPGSPFLPSDSDILLDSPDQDGIVEEFFVDSDSIPGQCQPSDGDKS